MNEGLQVQGDPGVAESQAQSVHAQWNSYDQVMELMQSMGLPIMTAPPIERPTITENDYLHIEGEDYARVSFRVNKWLEWATKCVAAMRGRLLCVANELDDLSVTHIAELREYYRVSSKKKPAEAELKDAVKLTPRYRELKQAEQNLTIARDHWQIEVDIYKKYGDGLSRQLTMRGQDIDLGFKGNRHARERGM